ncbi:hypothetical protein [Streptomyces sp. NPDC059802]|uniref:hypothetical protein n=1 Tax=Streptomyces sp. NPDC059802 TaxID=3346952 RepID=UPI003666662E
MLGRDAGLGDRPTAKALAVNATEEEARATTAVGEMWSRVAATAAPPGIAVIEPGDPLGRGTERRVEAVRHAHAASSRSRSATARKARTAGVA